MCITIYALLSSLLRARAATFLGIGSMAHPNSERNEFGQVLTLKDGEFLAIQGQC